MKTRFCPSPTGFIHLGNLRTALFSLLFTKAKGGQFLLRIEDTDQERSDSKYTEALMEDFAWLGFDWDEGPEKDLGNGPYWQSQRLEIYNNYYHVLEENDLAYPCFCTEKELAISRKVQLSSGKPPRYAGTCRNLSKEQIKEKLAQGLKPTLRFRIQEDEVVEFNDLVKGPQKFATNDLGDFIIRRADGTSPFMYCNAIDDSLMGITHVVRGADHVTNTPRQIMILDALELRKPEYAHISLITNIDGGKLSKRHGSDSIQDMRKSGILPLALINYLARLGHYYEDNEFMTLNELAKKFKVENLSTSPAKFDEDQLTHWQKIAAHNLDIESAWNWMGARVQAKIPSDKKNQFVETIKANVSLPDEALYWAEIFFEQIPKLNEEKQNIINTAGKEFFETAIAALEKFGDDCGAIVNHIKTTLNIKGKSLFMPLRIALTGETFGPELKQIFELLGKNEIAKRFNFIMCGL